MTQVIILGAAAVLAVACLCAAALIGLKWGSAIRSQATEQVRIAFPQELIDRIDKVEREQHGWIEAIQDQVETLETKRRRIAASNSAKAAQPPAPLSASDERDQITAMLKRPH